MQETGKKSQDFQIKAQKVENIQGAEKILINLNKCEKLFQEDKSEKLRYFH